MRDTPISGLSSSRGVLARPTREESKEMVYVEVSSTKDSSEEESKALSVPSHCVFRSPTTVSTVGKKTKGLIPSLPPPLQLVPTYRKTYRFTSTASGTSTITVGELVGALGGICTVANATLSCWTSSIRIHTIKFWPACENAGANQGYIEWFNNYGSYAYKDDVINYTTPESTSLTGCYTFKPPRGTLCGDWLNCVIGTSTQLFNITAPEKGCVVDIDVESTLGISSSTSTVLTQVSITSGTLGNIYYLALDGPSVHNFPPCSGMPTTF